jgi:3-hydroxyisobutyrate dehydrogenase-like beta-hydroxyacid dehydrogenase
MPERVGFIGLGNMGGRMTRCLVTAGHEVVGYDPDAERVTAAGATPADSPAAVTAEAEVVLLSLPDSPVVERVVRGDDGVLGAARSGQVIVDLSTASPPSTQAIHADLTAKGAEYLDAGISGGAAAAEKGTLTLRTGGSEDALERVRPILDAFSAKIFHMGASGSGHVAKLLNNFLTGVSLSATAEVMVAAKKAGLELHTFLDVLNASSGVNFATLNRFPKIVDGDYLEGGLSSDLMMKDLLLYMDFVHSIGTPSINAAGSVASFGVAARLGYGDQISNRVVDALGDLAGGIRLHDPTTPQD